MRKRSNQIKGQFVPAHDRNASLACVTRPEPGRPRILARIEIEHAKHGGRDNGRLPVTFANFREYGIDHDAVGPGLGSRGAWISRADTTRVCGPHRALPQSLSAHLSGHQPEENRPTNGGRLRRPKRPKPSRRRHATASPSEN